MEIFIRKLFIIILLVSFTLLKAQQPLSINLNEGNGLPSNTVYNLHQDKKGFIWLATDEGLYRYDGYEYVSYKSEQQTSKAGTNIIEDRYGRIWYENFDGYLYYVENDTLKAFKQEKPSHFTGFFGITNQHLFVIQHNQIKAFDLKTLKRLKDINSNSKYISHSVASGNSFYFLQNGAVFKIDPSLEVKLIHRLPHKINVKTQLYSSKKGVFVVEANNNSQLLTWLDTIPKTISIPKPNYIQGGDFFDDYLWLHSYRGTYAYHVTNNTNPTISLLKDESVSSVVKDRQNNLWVTTIANGVYVIPSLKNYYTPFITAEPFKITQTKNTLLVGTKNGNLYQYHISSGQTKLINGGAEQNSIYYLYHDSIDNNTIYSSQGFHIITATGKKKTYTIALKEIVRLDQKYYAIAATGFCALLLNPLAKQNQVSIWDKIYQQNKHSSIIGVSSLKNNIRAKAIDYNQFTHQVLCSGNEGLFVTDTAKTTEIKHKGNSFYAIKAYWHKNIIYALSTKGNFYAIKNQKHFELLNTKFKVKEFEIKAIKKIGNTIYVTTNSNLYRYHLDSNIGSVIQTGIIGLQFTDLALHQENLLLATNEGIISVANNAKQKPSGRLFINYMQVNGKEVDINRKVKLNHTQNNININFSILDFGNNNPAKAYFKINNNPWTAIGKNNRNLRLPALAAGKYTIEFKLQETEYTPTISFEITSPFWQEWWFYLLCSTVVLAIGYSYYKWQIRLIKQKKKLEYELNQSVLTSIKSQMNPHFFFNALNTIQAYIFNNDRTSANAYLAKFSKLTRAILTHSEKTTISLSDEIDALGLYLELEKMRFKTGFTYEITTKIVSSKEDLELPPMLIQPYVENAVKHGLLHRESNRKLSILFEENNQQLEVTITDNGIGRKRSEALKNIKNAKHQSFATQANKKRLDILNSAYEKIAVNYVDLYDSNQIAIGTTVIINIPLNK